MTKIKRVLIANRGEIASRIIKTISQMGIETVAIFSEIDRNMPFVRQADFAVCVGKASSTDTYLNIKKIINAANDLKCDAIHPGYGFLSENASFAEEVEKAGLIFIGPKANTIRLMGDKISAKKALLGQNIPLTPGGNGAIKSPKEAIDIANSIGFPVLIKASAGGGGKGMRIVEKQETLEESLNTAMNEAKSAFGDPAVFVEKYIQDPKHIEVQIMADQHGNILHLNERECSVQRRHQKVVEESPSAVVDSKLRKELGETAVQVARACDYVGAGTVEFIMDQEKNFYFLEMNTRLQVEHPVTEWTTGLDLVRMQIEIAEGKKLKIKQEDVLINGHSIELRIYAEDPEDHFNPFVGRLSTYKSPKGLNIRIDDGYEEGMEVPVYYDPLLSKLITWGEDRQQAIENMIAAIDQYQIEGVKTTLPFGKFVMKHHAFLSGEFSTNFVNQFYYPYLEKTALENEEVAAFISAFVYQKGIEEKISLSKAKTNWRNRLKD